MISNFEFNFIEKYILSYQLHNIRFLYDNYKYVDLICFKHTEVQLWSKLKNKNMLYIRFSKNYIGRKADPRVYFFKWPKDESMFYSIINPFKDKSYTCLYDDAAINKLINVIIGDNKLFSDKYDLK